ncbi:PREDICTED: BAHD acyltransferase At5g47980-like [Tarenaya hassleriana]|uniref:BAHD acyltransferase At5g47980-like n=1 Tax=Tarenaya hassleriana TaxID=28532 RepID=UPI00053C10B1|nr:PREDICTED: BAHD acyltransferase At5g47980-like [Tarenaya hassleriana]
MKLEIVGEEVIKPASPTSEHLRTAQLPLSGHLVPPVYVAAVFFYNTEEEIAALTLKKSLSLTLNRFYPLSGRIRGASINCNDEGVVFTQAKTDCLLSDFLRNPNLDSVKQFLPSDFTTSGDPPEKWPLLHVKLTLFRSRGMAVSVCVSHKVCDAASLAMFIHGWTSTAKGHSDSASPEFAAPTFFPTPDPSLDSPISDEIFDVGKPCVKKRFVFDASKIVELKKRAASIQVSNPTCVEAISGLVWRCARKVSGKTTPLVMTQAMDLRRRIPSTHLPHNTIGNLVFAFFLKAGPEEKIEIQEIVANSRKAKEGVNEMIKENLGGVRLGEKMRNEMVNYTKEITGEVDVYNITSWCGMKFYEADFGWGNPEWVVPGAVYPRKIDDVGVILMDAKDGEGIEAFVSLIEQDMSAFEQDQDLLAFASPNPTVLI